MESTIEGAGPSYQNALEALLPSKYINANAVHRNFDGKGICVVREADGSWAATITVTLDPQGDEEGYYVKRYTFDAEGVVSSESTCLCQPERKGSQQWGSQEAELNIDLARELAAFRAEYEYQRSPEAIAKLEGLVAHILDGVRRRVRSGGQAGSRSS